jgi:hypothetical protein
MGDAAAGSRETTKMPTSFSKQIEIPHSARRNGADERTQSARADRRKRRQRDRDRTPQMAEEEQRTAAQDELSNPKPQRRQNQARKRAAAAREAQMVNAVKDALND